MTDLQRRILVVIAMVGAVAVFALAIGVSRSSVAFFVLYSAFSAWRGIKRRREAKAFWGIVWKLRTAPEQERAQLLEELEEPKLRAAVEKVLRSDGSDVRDGDVERFPFPASLVAHFKRQYWLFWAGAVAMLVIAILVPSEAILAGAALVVATICGYQAWSARRKEEECSSLLEVTPFRITELLPTGTTRTLQWSGYLELHDEPKRSRVLLGSGEPDSYIVLDYRRMGFARLVDLVVTYGRFRTQDNDAPAS